MLPIMDAPVSTKVKRRLIEGTVGPFYVGVNLATFYLLAAVYAVISLAVVYLLRDRGGWLRVGAAVFLPLETAALLHIYLQKIHGWPKQRSRLVHLGVSLLAVPLAAAAWWI